MRYLVWCLLIACAAPAKPAAPAPPEPTPLRTAEGRVLRVFPGACEEGRTLVLFDVPRPRPQNPGFCWLGTPRVDQTFPVRQGRLPARVVHIVKDFSGCIGLGTMFLEAVVDGRPRRLYAGGHCEKIDLRVGMHVEADVTLVPGPSFLPVLSWLPADLPPVDGVAVVVQPQPRL